MLVMLISCEPQIINGLPKGWLEMPKELIQSYFFRGNSITYISENNDIKTFENEFNYHYEPYDMSTYDVVWEDGEEEPDIPKNVPHEELNISNDLKGVNIDNYLKVYLLIWNNRTKLTILYQFSNERISGSIDDYSGGNYVVDFENNPKKDEGMGYPKKPNEVFEHLTDTINLTYDGKLMGQLVAGKGLIWFTDDNGIKWYLKE